MPHHTVTGHQPKKLIINKIGGKGPEYGSDFTQNYARPKTYHPVQAPAAPGQHMMNRVQESLDNIILSPTKAHEAPPFAQYSYGHAMDPGYLPSTEAGYEPSTQPHDDDYEYLPVGERKKTFVEPSHHHGGMYM